HRREWELSQNRLCVRDTVTGTNNAVARFHLAPDVQASAGPDGVAALRLSGVTMTCTSSERIGLAPSQWHPEFGMTLPTTCIAVPFATSGIETTFSWQPQ